MIPIITVISGVIILGATTRMQIGRLISPFSMTLLMLLAIYGIRPLLMETREHFLFYGVDISSGTEAASVIGLFSVLGVTFGYLIAPRRNKVQKAQVQRSVHAYNGWNLSVVVSVLVLLLWLGVTVSYGGGLSYLAQMFNGRSSELSQTYSNLPAVVFALPVVACIIVAISRIRYEKIRRFSAGKNFLYWLVVIMCLIPPSALGNRRFMIPSLVAALVGAFATKWHKRIRPRTIVISISIFLIFAIFPFVRSEGSRTGSKDLLGAMFDYFWSEGFRGTLEGFFLSYDTEMYNYVSYLSPRLGETIPYGLGRGTFGEALLAPFPTALLEVDKWSDVLLTKIFGGSCAERFCPVPSLPGTLLYDFGVVGVLVGMVLVGVLFARFESDFLSAWGTLKLTTLVCFAAFTPVIIRGNPVSQLWIAFQCLVLLLLIDKLILRFSRDKRTTGSSLSSVSRQAASTSGPSQFGSSVSGKVQEN